MVKYLYVFHNGEIMPTEHAKVGIQTHALHYGTSCFEGIRGNWNPHSNRMSIFRMGEHYRRLARSARILHIDLLHSVEQLCEITVELVRKNGFKENIYIRPLAYKSTETVATLILTKLNSGISIIALPFGDYVDGAKPLRCMTSSWRRPEDSMMPTGVKISGLYTSSILAKTEATEAGFDEGILLNHNGTVSEGSGENLFLVVDGVLHTPAETENCLLGITRDAVITLAREELGLKVVERSMHRSEIYLADEVFLTGTAAHLIPVGSLDNRNIAEGIAGPITERLQKLYFETIIGHNEKYLDWCTIV